jgi:uncharacterized protein involved in outer membrane biogenesis
MPLTNSRTLLTDPPPSLGRRVAKWLLGTLLFLVLVVGAVLVAFFAFEQDTWGPLVESLVKRATGRTLAIEGELDARAGRVVSVRADKIRLANADWGSGPDFVVLEGVEIAVDLRRLLDGLLVIETVKLAGGKVLLEQDEQGRASWSMGTGGDTQEPGSERLAAIPLLIARADLAAIDIIVKSPTLTRPLAVHLQSVTQRAGERNELNAEIIGSVDDRPVTIRTQIKPFTQLLAAREVEFRIDADLDALTVAADGQVDDLLDPKQPRVRLTTEAPDVALLAAMFALPETISGPLSLHASMEPADDEHAISIAGSVGPYNLDAQARLQALDSIDGLAIDLIADGPDLKTAGDLAGVAGLPALPFNIRSQAALSGTRLEIRETRFEAGDNHLTVSGVMSQFPNLEGTNLELDLQGKNYLQFAELLGLEASQLEPAPFEFDGDLDYSARDKQTFTARASLGKIEGEFRGQLTEYPAFTGSQLSFLVNGPDSTVILRALGRPAVIQDSYIVHGDIERTEQGFTIERGALLLGAHELHLSGSLGNEPLREHTELSVRFESPDLASIVATAGYTGFVPAGTTKVVVEANAQPDGLHIDALSAGVGRISVQASGLISMQADLAGSRLDVAVKNADIAELLPPELLPYVVAGQSFDLTGKLETQPDRLAIKSLSVTLGDMQLDASGSTAMRNPLEDSAVRFAVRGANLAEVVPEQLVAYEFPQAEFSVSGEVSLKKNVLAVDDVKAAVGPDRARVSGIVPLATPTDGLRLEIAGSGPNLAALAPPELEHLDIEESPYEIAGIVELVDGRLSVERLSFSAAKGSIRGNLSVAMEDPLSFGRFDLKSGGVSFQAFFTNTPHYRAPPVPYELEARGDWDAERVNIERMHLRLDKSTIDVQGEVDLPPNVTATRLVLSANGDNLADLGQIQGLVLPQDEFHVHATLLGDADTLQLPELDAKIGESDLRGAFSFEFAEKPAINIELQSELLDLARLLPPEEDDPDSVKPPPEPPPSDGRLIPDIPTQGDRLNSINLVTQIEVGEIRFPGHTLRDLAIDTRLQDGDLTVSRFNASASKGQIKASFRATATGNHIVTRGSLEGFDIVLGTGNETEGGVRLPEQDFHLRFETEGSATRELAANLNGSVEVTGGAGRLENTGAISRLFGDFFTELLNLINPLAEKERYTTISCSAFFADITDGVLAIKPGAVLQTDKLNMFADGQIDLKTEQVRLRFNTAARTGIGVSVAAFVNPFVGVGGTLTAPKLSVDPNVLEGSLAYATAGGSILAKSLWDRWFGPKDPCQRLVTDAQKLRDEQAAKRAEEQAKETGQ